MEAFDNMLEAWTSIIPEYTESSNENLVQSSVQIFNIYLKCHLAPPDGCRTNCEDEVDEIEEDDRNKFKDQLQTIGMFGRVILSHSLPVLYRYKKSGIERNNCDLFAITDFL